MSRGGGTAPSQPAQPAQSAPRYLAVVRRGEKAIYRLLKEYLEARGLAEVVWDRRVEERRGGTRRSGDDRRQRDRRRPRADLAGRALGFLIARPESRAASPPRRPASG